MFSPAKRYVLDPKLSLYLEGFPAAQGANFLRDSIRTLFLTNASATVSQTSLVTIKMTFYTPSQNHCSSSSSDLSLASSPDSQPSASRSVERMPKLIKKPMKAIPPNTPNARASPFGWTLVATENRPPERKGPAARPAADSVWASPFNVPSTWWFGAELVI